MSKKKGSIKREDDKVIVEWDGEIKEFFKKKIYLPGEYEEAVAAHISGDNVIVLGMNGYSDLNEQKCKAYGIKHGDYEIACASLLEKAIRNLRTKFEGVTVFIAHGASNMGVDKSSINVGLKLTAGQLGFSCPNYMMYVDDDDIPVYVAADASDYCEAFTEALDILITANGRKTTFEMDIDAMFKKHKDVIPVNVLRSISSTGGPPAIDQDGQIEDAVAFWYLKMHHIAVEMGITGAEGWEAMSERVCDITTVICRRLMPASIAYNYRPFVRNW